MATKVQTQEAAIQGLNEKAGIFVGTIQIITTDDSGKPEKKDHNVFVLNSQEFIDLQVYLAAGIHFPASEKRFEFECPREAFDKFVPKDKELYNLLKEYLPPIQQHCLNFKCDVVGPMVNLGGEIANFAEHAMRSYGQLHEDLSIIADENRKLTDPDVKAAIARCRKTLRDLQTDATNKNNSCVPISEKLVAFQVVTEADKKGLISVNDRFASAIPNKGSLIAALETFIEEAGHAVRAAAQEIEACKAEAQEQGRSKWYWYIPYVGIIFVIYSRIKQKGLMKTLESITERYENSRSEGEKLQAKLVEAAHQVQNLRDLVEGAAGAIDKAIKALGKMKGAFSSLTTDLKKLSENLGYLEGDISVNFINERIVGFKDLESAKETWEKVYDLAKLFQMNGVILDIEDHKEV